MSLMDYLIVCYVSHSCTIEFVQRAIQVSKLMELPPPCTQITWVSFLDIEETSLKILHSAKLQHSNSSPISNSRCFETSHLPSHNTNYNMNSLLWLHMEMHIIYGQYIYICIPIGDIVTLLQKHRLRYIPDIPGYISDLITDIPRFLN